MSVYAILLPSGETVKVASAVDLLGVLGTSDAPSSFAV